jgi:hypothetical protein
MTRVLKFDCYVQTVPDLRNGYFPEGPAEVKILLKSELSVLMINYI